MGYGGGCENFVSTVEHRRRGCPPCSRPNPVPASHASLLDPAPHDTAAQWYAPTAFYGRLRVPEGVWAGPAREVCPVARSKSKPKPRSKPERPWAVYGMPTQEVFSSRFREAADAVRPDADEPGYVLPPVEDPLGAIFHQAEYYMEGVVEEIYLHGVMPRDYCWQQDLSLYETSEAEGWAFALAVREMLLGMKQNACLYSLADALWARAREFKPPPRRRARKPEDGLERDAARLALSSALSRNYGMPNGQADVVTALAEVAALTVWRWDSVIGEWELRADDAETEYFAADSELGKARDKHCAADLIGKTMIKLLAGTRAVRRIRRTAPVGGLVDQAYAEAETLYGIQHNLRPNFEQAIRKLNRLVARPRLPGPNPIPPDHLKLLGDHWPDTPGTLRGKTIADVRSDHQDILREICL